jgi:hypothetical protein
VALTATPYATPADLASYLPDESGAGSQGTALEVFLAAATAFLDEKCHQFFYAAGTATKYFDGDGTGHISTKDWPFYSVTTVSLAYFENQPTAQWIANLTGDGVSPGSNYFLYPRNPRLYLSAGATATRPFYGLDLAHIPAQNTLYLPSQMPGYLTMSITANWGWPAIPDLIRDICCKIAARAWHSRDAGWADTIGTAEIGVVKQLMRLDPIDKYALMSSGYVRHGIF